MSQNSWPAPSRQAFMSCTRDVPDTKRIWSHNPLFWICPESLSAYSERTTRNVLNITYIHRLIRIDSERRLLFAPHYLHDQRSGQVLKLFGHDHLVKVTLLHHKVQTVFLWVKINRYRRESDFLTKTFSVIRCVLLQLYLELVQLKFVCVFTHTQDILQIDRCLNVLHTELLQSGQFKTQSEFINVHDQQHILDMTC